MKTWLSLAALLFLTACGGEKLVREDVGDYDLNKYLVGTGIADNEANAKQRARADLAKIFEVEVKEDTSDQTQVKSGTKGINKSWQINRNISTYTNKILNGVQIASVKKQEKTTQYRAVAILPRQQAANSLQQQIRQIDTDINRNLASASSTNRLQNARAIYQALNKLQQRQQLQKALVVIDTNGKGMPSTLTSNQLAMQLQQALKQITVKVSAQGKSAIKIEQVIASALANIGVTLSNKGDYLLNTSLTIHDLGIIQGWNWYKSLVTLSLTSQNRRPLAQKKLTIKIAALDKGSAKIKLERKLLTQSQKALLNMILNN